MNKPILQVQGLKKSYSVAGSTIQALTGIDIEVSRGECMAVVGESGSGKTTLARLILDIERSDEGRIEFEGTDLAGGRSRALRRRIQFVQQNPQSALNPRRTVLQSVALPLVVHQLAQGIGVRDRAAQLLDMVGLTPAFLDRYPATLSGGQRHGVALARALAAEPDILILDEPTSALDVSVQALVLHLLVDLQARLGLTYLFITHDLGVVRNIAAKMTVLYRGHVVETGPTAAIFSQPRHRYTQMLLSAIPVVSNEDEVVKPDWPWDREIGAGELTADSGCAFSPRCAYAVDECRESAPSLNMADNGSRVACYNPG